MFLPLRPRIVFFDAAGTLLHLPKGVAQHYQAVARRHGADLDPAMLGKAFRTAFHTVPPPITTKAPRPDDDKSWWRAVVWQVLDACAAPTDFPREAYFEELYREFTLPGVWQLYPEAREVLAALAPHYRLGIISNFDGRLRTVLQQEGVTGFFETWTISSEVGADKPDPWIYESALRQAGVEAAGALHVGDDPEGDWEAAAAAGLHVFRLARPEKTLNDLLPLLLP